MRTIGKGLDAEGLDIEGLGIEWNSLRGRSRLPGGREK
jgi:hypothetical protein